LQVEDVTQVTQLNYFFFMLVQNHFI